MKLDETILQQIIKSLDKGQEFRQVQIYSRPALVILRYLDLSTPGFSKGGAAGELLTEPVKKEYPVLWEKLTALNIPETEEKDIYLPRKFPKIIKTKWAQAVKESKERKGRLVTVYNPKVSAILRYNMQTIPRYKMSAEAAKLIEEEISRRYPDVWGKVSEQ